MVVKNDNAVEDIREIMRRLDVLLSSADGKVLAEVECELVKMECKLRLFRKKD